MVDITSRVNTATTITAENYNFLRNKIVQVLGTGGGDASFGYGHTTFSSSTVTANNETTNTVGDTVTAAQMDYLRADIERAWEHQTTDTFTLGNVATNDFITAGATDTESKSYNEYFATIETLVNNRLNLASDQRTITTHYTDQTPNYSLNTSWGGLNQTQSRTGQYRISFGSTDSRRYFFNSGGQISLTWSTGNIATGGSASLLKNTAWVNIVSQLDYTIDYTENNLITATSRTVKDAINDATTASGNYAENYATITVRTIDSGATIEINISLVDADTGDDTTPDDGYGYKDDEVVNVPITVRVRTTTATGSWIERPIPSVLRTASI